MVDQENPLNSKIFDPTNKENTDDINLLTKHRLTQNHDHDAPSISMNFPGFAAIF